MRRRARADEATSLGDALREREVPAERAQSDCDARVRCCAGVCERGPEVVVLELELPDAGLPVRSTEPCTCPVGNCRVVLRVGLLRRGQPAALGKTLERVVAHGVEHVVARVGTRERDRDDRLVDERP